MDHRRVASVSVLLVMLLVAAACGQKPGVADRAPIGALGAGGAGNLQVDPETGNIINPETGEIIDPETGEVIGTTEGVDLGGTDAAGGGGTGTGTTGGGTTAGGGTTEGGGTGEGAPTGGTAAGVTAKTIKIGIHAPLSGAAPVPSDSVEKGKDLFFKWMEREGKSLFGRNVQVVLKNDQYNPSTAVAVCKEMVEKENVFLLSGAAGTDQIQACARYAESVGVPYLSAGVTEALVSNFRTYFTTSMTYPDQGPLLVDFMLKKLGAKTEKNGMLFFDTASFADAHDAFKAAAARAGMKIDYDRKVSKNADFQTAQSVVQEMKLEGIENVYILTSPIFFVNVLKAANSQAFSPQWTGVGITMTFDTVLSATCPDGDSVDGAKFFSPFPAFIDVNKFDPEFMQASRAFYPTKNPDDFMVLSWSFGKILWEMFERVGKDLTRERFIYTLERSRGLRNGLGPVLNYTPTDHLGADQVHVSEARCSDRRWHTIQSFVSDF